MEKRVKLNTANFFDYFRMIVIRWAINNKVQIIKHSHDQLFTLSNKQLSPFCAHLP